jgi:gamma-glutamylcyclotransferase (GGCT)/AIG2-like uncharacterized protein YtfP
MDPSWHPTAQAAAHIAQVVTGIATLCGGLWALVTYTRASKRQSAEWIQGVFEKFQLGTEFDEAKLMFDFRYRDVVEPMLAAMVAQGNAGLSEGEWERSHRIDRLLNYLEHICYLSQRGHSRWGDCRAYFGYWLSLPCAPERGTLRRYLVHFGYEHLAEYVKATKGDYILVYGTLLSSEPGSPVLDELRGMLEVIETREIPGQLYDLGAYPAYVPGPAESQHSVRAELCKLRDPRVLERLDKYEEYDRFDLARTEYRRTTLQLPLHTNAIRQWLHRNPMIDPWIYVFNGSPDGLPLISAGSWTEHRKTKRAVRVRPVRTVDDSAFSALVSIYNASIVASERKPEPELALMLSRHGYTFLVAEMRQDVVGFAILYQSTSGQWALLEYMAVNSAIRSQGVGKALFERCVELVGSDTRLLLEVDSVEPDGPNTGEQRARQRFYRRQGCLGVVGLRYLLPLRTESEPPAMELFVHAKPGGRASRANLRVWLRELYVEVYAQKEDDPRIDGMTASLPDSVDLR